MLLVDSHCHLNFPDYKEDIDAVITRARDAGVGIMQTICTEMAEFDEVYAIAERHESIYCSIGVHPNDSAKAEIPAVEEIVKRAAQPKTIGIGETGLDYHYENSPRAHQQESFLVHIEAARQSGLPLIIHTRDAEEDTARILEEEMKKKPFRAVLHCFTSSQKLAEHAVALGLYVSFSGIISFKNAADIRETAKILPQDRILIETDAPFLAPAPFRGKRNEPSYVAHTNRCLAELRGISEEECASLTTANFFRLFDKAKRP